MAKGVNIWGFAVFLLAALICVAADPSIDDDGWETETAVVKRIEDIEDEDEQGRSFLKPKFIETLKTIEIKKKCECSVEGICSCCIALHMEDKERTKVCFSITGVDNEKKVQVSISINDKDKFTKNIGEKDKCLKIPYTMSLGEVCLSLTNLKVDVNGLHGCVKVMLKLLKKEAVTVDLNCLVLSKKKLSIESENQDGKSGLINLNPNKIGQKIKDLVKKG